MAFNISQEDTKFDCNLITISFNNGCLIQHFLIYGLEEFSGL